MTERISGGNGRFNQETAVEMGKRGAKGRKPRLTLSYVEAALPKLDSLEHAQERLHIVSTWLAAGMLSGSVGGAFVRATEVWIRALESRVTAELVGELRQRVEELEEQLKRERNLL